MGGSHGKLMTRSDPLIIKRDSHTDLGMFLGSQRWIRVDYEYA